MLSGHAMHRFPAPYSAPDADHEEVRVTFLRARMEREEDRRLTVRLAIASAFIVSLLLIAALVLAGAPSAASAPLLVAQAAAPLHDHVRYSAAVSFTVPRPPAPPAPKPAASWHLPAVTMYEPKAAQTDSSPRHGAGSDVLHRNIRTGDIALSRDLLAYYGRGGKLRWGDVVRLTAPKGSDPRCTGTFTVADTMAARWTMKADIFVEGNAVSCYGVDMRRAAA